MLSCSRLHSLLFFKLVTGHHPLKKAYFSFYPFKFPSNNLGSTYYHLSFLLEPTPLWIYLCFYSLGSRPGHQTADTLRQWKIKRRYYFMRLCFNSSIQTSHCYFNRHSTLMIFIQLKTDCNCHARYYILITLCLPMD